LTVIDQFFTLTALFTTAIAHCKPRIRALVQRIHPKAQLLIKCLMSSCILLVYSIRSKNIGQSNARALSA